MSFKYVKPLPTPAELLDLVPISPALQKIKTERDLTIKNVFTGKDPRFILIIGPCSAHNADAVCEYVTRLAKLQDEVKDQLILIPRIYTNKPRTTGEGYKGMAHQADPNRQADYSEGLIAMRKMHLRALEISHLSPADEMLYPGNYPYLEDILSYVAIGARSVENQEHRLTVSGLDVPAGMKNPTSGDFAIMLNSVQAAQQPHDFIYNGWTVKSDGNALCHCILRGAVTQYGQAVPNYHHEDITRTIGLYKERDLQYPAIMIDTNHANSNKQFREQTRIALEVMRSRQYSAEVKNYVKGLMIESYLEEGAQALDGQVFGKSITDPCLGWNDTVHLVKEIAEQS